MADVVLTQTRVMRDKDGPARVGAAARKRYIWRGPATDPVFAFQNCRDLEYERIDVVCETPCEAVVVCERTRNVGGTIPSTHNAFKRWRIYGNGLAAVGFWYRGIDANNEHGHFDGCTINDVTDAGFVFEGQNCKEHLISHCRIDGSGTGVIASTSFLMLSGAVTRCEEGIRLGRAGDPVTVIGTGFEACGRLLVTSGPSTDAQSIVLQSVRYAADQLHPDGAMILMRHAGPLTVIGGSYGDGDHRVPQIHLAGIGEQAVNIIGAKFGAFNADTLWPPVTWNLGVRPTVTVSGSTAMRDADYPERTKVVVWP